MIVQFKAVDLDTFRGTFDGHVVEVRRVITLWHVFVDGKRTAHSSLSPATLRRRVEVIAERVVTVRAAANPKPAQRFTTKLERRADTVFKRPAPKPHVPGYLTSAKPGL